MKTLVMTISCLILLMQSVSILAFEAEEIEGYLDKILRGHINYGEYEKPLLETIGKIEQQLEKENDNPYLWYLKGRSSYAALRVHGVVHGKKDSRYKELRKQIPIEYEKTLSLNKIKNSLTTSQLSEIYTRGFTNLVSVEATRQYIELKKQKTTLHEKEHLRLLWERVVFGLIKQNKFDEAYEEMTLMEANFPPEKLAYANGKPWRVKLDEKIEKQKAKLAAASQQVSEQVPEEKPEESTAKELEESTPAIVAVKQAPVAKVAPAPQKDTTGQATDNNKTLIIGLALAVLLLIGFVIAKRKKN